MSSTPQDILDRIQKARKEGRKELNLDYQRYLGYPALSEIPSEVFELEHLEDLNLANNQIKALPADLHQLQNLKRLDLRGNPLETAPDVAGLVLDYSVYRRFETQLHPKQVRGLKVTSDEVPHLNEDAIFETIVELDLSDNGLTALPESISQLTNLTTLYLGGNPLETPPPDIVAGGIDAIREYFRQLKAEGEDHIYEAKLLVVGEPGAGKTTLAKKIQDPDYELRDDEKSTEGIEVIPWSFEMADGQSFQVNIWDFGGQEIYKATHQFFLTKRSLYALVVDSRKEDTDFNYWLSVVALLSDNSPLLIVKNEKQDRQRPINEKQLRGQFTNLKETLATNLKSKRGLPELLTQIKHYLTTLPHIGSALPKTWVNVRNALDENPANYISQDAFLAICTENGFSSQKDALQLSGYLHDLGVCLHFQDDPVLRHTVILKPEWGTAAVYKVLDNKNVVNNLGCFSRTDLDAIWHEAQYAGKQDDLLQLMINFKLCYRVPGPSDLYLAPELLSENQAPYDWDAATNLHLRYTYDFMPKGLLTQFIVAMHPHIERDNEDVVWKTGVVLRQGRTRAEVVEHYNRREIAIRVSGARPRDLLTVVLYELDQIHAAYHGLKYRKLIPCTCATCQDLSEPHFYPYDKLKEFEDLRREDIQCLNSGEMISVRGLLDAVIDPAQRYRDKQDERELMHRAEREPPTLALHQEVFLSYAWGDEREEIVDKLDEAFKQRDIRLVRDKRDLGFKGRIKAFMEQIGRGKCVIVVISKKYLESENCMFELLEVAKKGDFYDRIFPMVLGDAQIYDPVEALDYILYWDDRISKLNAKLKQVASTANLQGFHDKIDLYTEIRATIAERMDILQDMNALTATIHEETGFDELIRAVTQKLAE